MKKTVTVTIVVGIFVSLESNIRHILNGVSFCYYTNYPLLNCCIIFYEYGIIKVSHCV